MAAFYGFRPARELTRGIATPPEAHPLVAIGSVWANVHAPLRQPTLAFHAAARPRTLPAETAPRNLGEFSLSIVGEEESIGEALIIKAASTIAGEWGTPVVRIRVNAYGDRESRERFGRELAAFFKRRANMIAPEHRAVLAEPLAALSSTEPAIRELLLEGPRSIQFLSERSRQHFKRVLERIEQLGFAYDIDDQMLPTHRDAQVGFMLDTEKNDTVVSMAGGRFDDFIRRAIGRNTASAVYATIQFHKQGLDRSAFTSVSVPRDPKVYFIRLGDRAQVRGLAVIDHLRHARVPVSLSFGQQRLSDQLRRAAELGASYLIIMGEKEAIDSTVIMRSTKTLAQETVPVQDLVKKLRHLRL